MARGEFPHQTGSMNQPNPSLSASDAQLGVFIVEDSPVVRARIEEMLAEIPGTFQAGHASAAEQAIRAIHDTHPDIVLLDMHLENGTGLDVLRAVHPQLPEIAFYMVSSFTPPFYRRAALRLGATAYFDKTCQMAELRHTLASLAGRSVQEHQVQLRQVQ